MPLNIEITGSEALLDRLYSLPRKLRDAQELALNEVADLILKKVLENLSGKVLQRKSSQLYDSIKKDVYSEGYDFIAFVGPVPATPKAYALEYGGKGSYVIPIGKAGVLANKDENFFSKRDVVHPPSKEYAYLRSVLLEVRDEIPRTINAHIKGAI